MTASKSIAAARGPQRRSGRRRLAFAIVTAGLLLLCGELASRVVLWTVFPDWQDLVRPPAVESTQELSSGDCLHPFYGLAYDAQTHPGVAFGTRTVPITELGLAGLHPPVAPRHPDRLRIGVLGGSFAWQFSIAGAERLASRLREHPDGIDREIEVISLAAHTFKQPQQLMVLNYALALGAEFDVLLNIDGFNEVALAKETADEHVFYAYPRMWIFRTAGRGDPRLLESLARIQSLRTQRQAVVERLRSSSLSRLGLVRLWWVWRERRAAADIQSLSSDVRDDILARGVGFERSGPPNAALTAAEFYSECAALWRRASRQLHAVAAQHECLYLHALQPNQYVADSKPLTPQEREAAYDETSLHCRAVREGYPRLQAEGATLQREGVAFVDLTHLFADVADTVYVDPCCHLNAAGYELTAERLADEILARLPASAEPPTAAGPEGTAVPGR